MRTLRPRFVASIACVLAAAACSAAPSDPSAESSAASSSDAPPTGKGGGTMLSHASGTASSTISNHGGSVMAGLVNVYYIWYGSWSSTPQTILTDFASHIGGSDWFSINTTYASPNGVPVTNSVRYAGSTTDSYSRGTSLQDGDIQTIVSSAISSGRLPNDSNGVYMVLTSKDVSEGGFCSSFCGWHTHGTIGSTDIKYAFIGDGDRCPSACQPGSAPNEADADGMASVIAHELSETVSDPQLNAWYDGDGEENADKCAWNFGTTYKTGSGASANVHLGSRDYLIQQNWVNVGNGYCGLRLPSHAETVGDFTGDHYADYVDHRPSDGAFYVHANLRNGSFAPIGQNAATGTTCVGPDCDVLVGDFTGDGYADYADHRRSDGAFWVHENMRNGTFHGAGTNWATGNTCVGPDCDTMVGDFTGDGYADYADRNPSTGNFWVHQNLRNGTFAGAGVNWGTGQTCAGSDCNVLVADFNGDGYADYADHNPSTGGFWVHLNYKNGTFAPVGTNYAIGTTCAGWDCKVLIGDFTGDGAADYADFNVSNGTFFIHQNYKNGTFAPVGTNWGTGTTSHGANTDVLGQE